MSWLAGNWYSVIALFGAQAVVGIALWLVAHRIMGQRERDDRERQARKLGDLQLSRTPRRR